MRGLKKTAHDGAKPHTHTQTDGHDDSGPSWWKKKKHCKQKHLLKLYNTLKFKFFRTLFYIF